MGDTIYEVYAQVEPMYAHERGSVPLQDKLVKIAELKLKTDLVTSRWGDEKLFFRHRRVNNDHKFWPNAWLNDNEDHFFSRHDPENRYGRSTPAWPQDEEEAKDLYMDQEAAWGCPFEWLMPAGWKSSD